MAVEKIYHVFDKSSASEYVILQDSHGRKLHVRAPILHGPPADEFIAQQIAEFEAQEKAIDAHIAAGFDPETLHKK